MSDLTTPAPAIRLRSTSLSSLSSIDSADSAGTDWGHLRVFTGNIKAETDFKTVKISTHTSALSVIEMMLSKFRLAHRDPNLFRICMEITTRHLGQCVKTILELDDSARPLELQRCHPQHMSRFLMVMANDPVLTRIDDSAICPILQLQIVAAVSPNDRPRNHPPSPPTLPPVNDVDETHFKLFCVENDGELELNYDKLVLRRLD
ncbi:Ras association domain protein [Aphelenchoides fujianensis]|nr:Ras association domain protein [Aphelenchoides fujianensis]